MDAFQTAFGLLISACGLLTWRQYRFAEVKPEEQSLLGAPTPLAKEQASRFTILFLSVYCLVMASDWLQGPYVYSLYHDQFGLNERIVALLFTTGFLSAGISGYFVGQFADKYGRRTACLVFCFTYSMACFATLVPNLPTLFLGRLLGGLSTSFLYSTFDSWMVTEFHKRKLDKAGKSLNALFGIMSTLNSVAAILSGVFSEWLVQFTGTKRSPFMASAALLGIASVVITKTWTENYGDTHVSGKGIPASPRNPEHTPESTPSPPSSPSKPVFAPTQPVLSLVFKSPRILTLGLASCIFEGSMYLFVFFWTPALKAVSKSPSSLPLGLIFASFMASVMLGSLLFTILIPHNSLLSPSALLTLTFILASISISLPLLHPTAPTTFWSFCLFELCVGLYWPTISSLKSALIPDSVRARVYGLLRIPLNVFVVVALSLTREGADFREKVFVACSCMLVGGGAVLGGVLR